MANLPSFKSTTTGKVYSGGSQISTGERQAELKERQSEVPIFRSVTSGKTYDGTQAVRGQTTRSAKTAPPTYDPNKRFSDFGGAVFPSAKGRYTAADVTDAENWLKSQSEKLSRTKEEMERQEQSWGDIRIAPSAADVQYAELAKRRTPLALGGETPKSYYDLAKEYNTGSEDFRKNYGAYSQMLQQIEEGAGEYDARATELRKQAQDARVQEQRLLALASERRMDTAQAQQIAPEIEYWRRQAEDLEKQAKELEETSALVPGIRFQRKYGGLSDAEDFAEKSGYHEELTEEGPSASDLTRKWAFPLYEIVNGNDEARDAYTARRMSLYGGNANPLGALWGGVADNAGEARDMTEDEVALFNYIYHTQGREAAQEFYNEIRGDLNARRRLREQQEWGQYATEHPIESSLFSIVESPLRGMSYLGQAADLMDDGKIDQNAGYNRFTTIPGDIRAAVAKEIEDSGKWGKAGSFLYQTGMSMGDFLMSTAASGGNEALSLAIMGTGAAADTVITAKERGLSDRQAFALGTIAGAAEVITEKVSIDALLDKTSMGRSMGGYLLKNVLAEGSEEVGSDVINLVADILIAKDKSEWQTSIRKMREENPELSEKDAFWRAVLDQAQQMGLDFLGGAISGGVMAGGSIAVNAAASYAAAAPMRRTNSAISDAYAAMEQSGMFSPQARAAAERASAEIRQNDNARREGASVLGREWPTQEEYDLEATGAQYIADGPEALNDLIEEGLARPAGTEARQAAQRLTEALESGEEIDLLREIGRLHNAIADSTETDTEANLPEIAPGEKITGRMIREVAENGAQLQALGIETEGKSRRAIRDEVRQALENLQQTAAETAAADIHPAPDGDTTAPTRGAKAVSAPDSASPAETLRKMAKDGGLGDYGARVMEEFHHGERAPEYFGGFAAAYNAGRQGRELETVQTPLSLNLSPEQRQAAWEAGRMDAITAQATENKQAPAQRSSAAEAVNITTGGKTNAESAAPAAGEGRQLSDGNGGRDAGQRSGEQAGRLERGKGAGAAAEVRTAAERGALVRDLQLKPVDPTKYGAKRVVDNGNTYELPEEHWDKALQEVARNVRKYGFKPVFILGPLSIERGNGKQGRARGMYVSGSGTIVIQADCVSATPEQIMQHELWHAMSSQVRGQDELLEERIRKTYGEESFRHVLDRYIRALAGVIDIREDMTPEQQEEALRAIRNELFADAASGLNGFGAGAPLFTQLAREVNAEFWGIDSQTAAATEQTTGPPAGDAMFSPETENDADERAKSFSYDSLIKKGPVRVVQIQSKDIPTRRNRINANALAAEARAKAPVIVYQAENGNASEQRYVFIPDLDANVLFNTKGVLHGAVGNITNASARVTAEVTPDLAEILQNSIKVNERGPRAIPKRGDGEYSHVLIGAAQNENGEVYIVRSQINHMANNVSVLESMEIYDVLKGAKGKKMEPEVMRSLGLKKPQPDANTTDSYYTVADFLELVKENYPSILPKDVLAHYGIDASVQDDGIMFSVDDEADPDELRRELRERGNVETRRALADTDRAAFRENEEQRRRIRREIRETKSKPKEITAMEKDLARLRDRDYQHRLLDEGGAEAVTRNAREIARLEQRLERLRGEQETRPARERKKAAKKANAPSISVKQLQNDLLRYFSIPEGQRAELGKFVSAVANKIYREGKLTQTDYDEVLDRLYTAGVVTVPATEYQRAGREAVKDGRIYVPADVKAEFGDDWNRFRVRAMAAGLYLVNDNSARGADQWNMELSELFPGIFRADNLDQRSIIEQIVQLAEEGKDQKMSLSDYTAMIAGQEFTTEDMLREGMERHIDWALRTFAQKAGLEVYLKDRSDARVQQERAAAWDRRQQELERKKANRELKELQQKTLKQLQWLSANRNKAPAELRAAFDEVLSDIDVYAASAANALNWSKRYQMTWRDLADMYDAKTNKESPEYDPNFFPSEELKRIYERLRVKKQHIADMDIGALQDLYKAAAGLRQEVYDRNNLVNDEFNRTIAGTYYDSKAELEAAAKARKKSIVRAYDEMQLTPMNRFESMAGWKKNSTWASMARMLERGERDQRHFTVNAKAMLADFLKQNEKWVSRADGQGKDGIWYEVQFAPVAEWGEMDQPIFGDPVTVWMTPAMKVQLYLESKSEDNLRHMAGGRTFADKELYAQGDRAEAYASGRTFKMTPEAVRRIVSDLTPEERALADVLEQFYNDFSKREINRVSNLLYGYDKAMGRYYAPIFTDSNYTQSSPGIFDLTAEGVGNLKERRKSWTPSMMISAFDAFEKSVDKTAKFVGLAIPIRNMNALWNWWEDGSSMKDVVEHTQGAEAGKFIEDLMTELQGNKEMKHPKLEQLMDKALSKYVSAVFGFNPSIVLKQFASFPLAASYLGWGNMPKWIPGAAQIDRELVRTYTGELGYRNMGYATPETALLKDNPGILQKKGIINFVFGGGAINWMDDFTVRSLWSWAENKVRKDQPTLRPGTQEQIDAGTDAFYKAVAAEFEEAVSRSQPMYDIMHRSQVMREGGGLARAFTMFKTVPQQEYNMLREAFGEMAAAKESGDAETKRAAAAKVGRAVSGVLVGNMMIGVITFLNALLKNRAKAYRDDDGELTPESAMKQFGLQYFRDSIGLTIGGDVIADVLGAAFGARWYGLEAPGVEQVNEILEGISNAGKNVQRLVKDSIEIASNGGDWEKYMREHSFIYTMAVEDAVKILGTYAGGLPVNNIRAYLLGAMQWMSPEVKVAYEDAVKHADRNGLKGLSGDALELRLGHIMSERLEEPSDELTTEIAGLYAAGYTEAVPTAVPTSVSIDGVDHSLNLVQQQTYSNVWQSAVGESLEELIRRDAYQNADQKTRAAMVKKLYTFAANEAKGAVFEEYDSAEANKRADAVMDAGATLEQYAQISAAFSEIDADKTKTSTERGEQKRGAVLAMELSDQEKLDVYAAMSDAEKRSEKLQAIHDTGLNTARVFEVYDRFDEISASGMAASEKAAAFSKWIDEQHFTNAQAATIREQLTFSAFIPASGGTYDKFTAAGLTPARSYQLFETMRELEPEDDAKTVSDSQKLRAINAMAMSDDDKIKAMGVILGADMVNESGNPTAYAKMLNVLAEGVPIGSYLDLRDAGQVDGFLRYRTAAGGEDYGITPEIYISYRETLPQFDDGNNSYTQKEVQAALDAMQIGRASGLGGLGGLGNSGSGLTRQQKAVLWQLTNSGWKPYKNPYDTQIGQAIYDNLHAEKTGLGGLGNTGGLGGLGSSGGLGSPGENALYRAALGMANNGLLS